MNENLGIESKRVAGVEGQVPPRFSPPPAHDPAEAFGLHFIRCFFCRIGDRYIEDHFCETGRELLVAVLDEVAERQWERFYAEEWDFEEGPFGPGRAS